MKDTEGITLKEILNKRSAQRKLHLKHLIISSFISSVSFDVKQSQKRSNILPNNYIRVFHPEPGREHPSIGTSHSDDRAVLSSM